MNDGPGRADDRIHLTKSRYVCGLQCLRWLWLSVHRPDAPELIPDVATQALFDQGTEVCRLARTYVPGGVSIDASGNGRGERLDATREALRGDATALYEACFEADGVFVAVDILERDGAGWRLVEVKSSTRVKPEHMPDVAVQLHVLRRCGLPVEHVEVMHLNRACVHPEMSDLFTRTDVTAEAEACVLGVPDEIERQLAVLRGPMPDPEIDRHCREPYPCPLKDGCWASLPDHHVTTLYYGGARAFDLMRDGHELVVDVPSEALSHAAAARQQRAIAAGRTIVEGDLAAALARFQPPLAHLDFETINPAVPLWAGCRPFDQVPVQFSCHIERADGTLEHREWLAESGEGGDRLPPDPRPAIARAVIDACRDARTVVGYYTPFERGRLEDLAAAIPDLAAGLASVIARLADLRPCVLDHVYHPDFRGSFSLKDVLPALVPGMGYEDLEVRDGTVASVRLRKLIVDGEPADPAERDRLRRALGDYCRTDTLATKRLLDRLREIAAG